MGRTAEGSKAEMDVNTVKADELTWQTAQPDVFTGGDCATGPKFAINAIAEGKKEPYRIHRFVQPGFWPLCIRT